MRTLAAIAALVVVTVIPAAAQHLPHGARDFFEPAQKAPPRVTRFAPNPADIFYEDSATQVFRNLPPER